MTKSAPPSTVRFWVSFRVRGLVRASVKQRLGLLLGSYRESEWGVDYVISGLLFGGLCQPVSKITGRGVLSGGLLCCTLYDTRVKEITNNKCRNIIR